MPYFLDKVPSGATRILLNYLAYMDDFVLVCDNEGGMQTLLEVAMKPPKCLVWFSMFPSVKYLVYNRETSFGLVLEDQEIEEVEHFEYL